MNISECYSYMGEDFDSVMHRIMKADRIEKYLRRMFEEGYYEKLLKAYESGVVEDIFSASHDLKGVCLNLGLNRMAEASSLLCDAVRGGEVKGDIAPLMQAVNEAYIVLKDAIEKLA